MSVRKLNLDGSDVGAAFADLNSTATGITAFAGGGQAGAPTLLATYNRVTTVATLADSVKLPVALAGSRVVVHNRGAVSMNVFPPTGGVIGAAAANAAFALAATKGAEFICMVDGIWDVILSA